MKKKKKHGRNQPVKKWKAVGIRPASRPLPSPPERQRWLGQKCLW